MTLNNPVETPLSQAIIGRRAVAKRLSMRKSELLRSLLILANSMARPALVLAVLVAAGLLQVTGAYGQAQNTGTLSGNVTDMQGMVVTSALASLTSPSQGKTITVKANEKGEFLFTDVAVGTYMLTVTGPTFEAYTVSSVQVDADQNVRLDAVMKVGAADETVTVEGAGTTIDTRSATIGMMIDNQLVENLAIDGGDGGELFCS